MSTSALYQESEKNEVQTYLDSRRNGTKRRQQQLLSIIDIRSGPRPAVKQRLQNLQKRSQQRRVSLESVHRASLENDDETSVEGEKGSLFSLGVLLGSLGGSGGDV